MKNPLVTIICLCYNHERFVLESINSVLKQSYDNIQIIVVDDGSRDGSRNLIAELVNHHPDIQFLDLKENIGNTKAFNRGLELASGKYIIDLACDDILYPSRVESQVEFFEQQPDDVGVIYADVIFVGEGGEKLYFFQKNYHAPLEGNVFSKLINTYFICPPSMMMKKQVLDELQGYDEELVYEDFDFWIRSSKNWKYAFQNEISTCVRKVSGSHSSSLYKKNDKKLLSTYIVCQKIKDMMENDSERIALMERIKYEMRHAFLTDHPYELKQFNGLLKEIKGHDFFYSFITCISHIGINLSWLRTVILRIKHRRT